jgi:D-beta-D-heptose 7-phosphate kinase/D-beta-D-heptose 1-phosphate adenosyltransferase
MNYTSLIESFAGRRVLVIGEMMLDTYLYGTSSRVSREAPVPIVTLQAREDVPGAAANAAVNIAALGAQVTFLTVCGDDKGGRRVAALLQACGVETEHILYAAERETLTKKRVLADDQVMVRYDYGTTAPITPPRERSLIERLRAAYADADAVLVSDYGYGVMTERIIAALRTLRRLSPRPLVVDAKYLTRYHQLQPDAVKPNYGEAVGLLGLKRADRADRVDQMMAYSEELLNVTGAFVAAVTLDSDGAVIFERGRSPYRTYARPVHNSKAVGAGDTYAATLTLSLALGLETGLAAELASAAAGVVVRKNGTASCSADELIQFFASPSKIALSREDLAEQVEAYRAQGKRTVFTNGCFDILHRGHVTYLAQARALGDVLIVAVNTDESVRALKGAARPINTLDDRMHVLAALDCVDHVVAFGESTPVELIKQIKPDVFAKGGDYTRASLPEAPVVEALGGTVEILPYVLDRSTTAMIRKVQRK